MSLLAEAIAHEEGFYVAGSLPQRNNNPGDLRHSPHSFHTSDKPNAIGKIDSVADGWADLNRQLELDATRGWTVRQLVYKYAPPSENNTADYLNYVCKFVGCTPNDLVSRVITIKGDDSWQTTRTNPQSTGSPAGASAQARSLAPQSHSSWWQAITNILKPSSDQSLQE